MRIQVSLVFFILFHHFAKTQNYYENKFISTLSNIKTENNIDSIKAFSLNKNVLKFMELGYFINGNSLVAKFELNDIIINNIIEAGADHSQSLKDYKWIVSKVSKSSLNASKIGKEFILYEGYLFRYVAQYQYLNPKNTISDKDVAKNTFFKWYNRSIYENGDASLLHGIRLHMGSHWATTAAYLTKLDPENKNVYQQFIDRYNQQLRMALKVVQVDGNECYVWNSTYPEQFTRILKKREKETVIQDVSHGNHIVQYVIDSYSLGIGKWSRNDLERFANTLKYIIWNEQQPSDNVDGTMAAEKSLVKTGWKQSDGWMKLMTVLNDKELYSIYDTYYYNNALKVNKFYPNLQFFALMSTYQNNNK